MKNVLLCVAVILVGLSVLSLGQQPQATPGTSPAQSPDQNAPEISTTLMETTYLIKGPSAKPGEEGKERVGTGFIMARRTKPNSDIGVYVLITAKHVFEDIRGDEAIVLLRKRNADGDAVQLPITLKIRAKGKNLFTEHPTADVVAIDVDVPTDSIIAQLNGQIASVDFLATNSFLKDIAIHPGDELLCLGYPFGRLANDAGYPILRAGKIASYPIIPLEKSSPLLYDFRVEPGNSGGPVYLEYLDRPYQGKFSPFRKVTYQKIFGLVTKKADPIGNEDPYLGVIVPSIYIKETIDRLAGFVSTIEDN